MRPPPHRKNFVMLRAPCNRVSPLYLFLGVLFFSFFPLTSKKFPSPVALSNGNFATLSFFLSFLVGSFFLLPPRLPLLSQKNTFYCRLSRFSLRDWLPSPSPVPTFLIPPTRLPLETTFLPPRFRTLFFLSPFFSLFNSRVPQNLVFTPREDFTPNNSFAPFPQYFAQHWSSLRTPHQPSLLCFFVFAEPPQTFWRDHSPFLPYFPDFSYSHLFLILPSEADFSLSRRAFLFI